MAATRRNILNNTQDRDRFIDACIALKMEPSGFTTADLGIPSGPRASVSNVSTWDLFVIWHQWAMEQSSSDGRRNAAHTGPVFLPWHRWYLLLLEFQMRRILGVGPDDFGIPYWDWAHDGTNNTAAQQRNALALWGFMGSDSQSFGEVTDGPFTYSNFPLNIEQGPGQTIRATDRGLRRSYGTQVSTLPTVDHVNTALAVDFYDQQQFDRNAEGFRNSLEGWIPNDLTPALHNRVHVWIGGDMLPGTSPNDPLFFLNHCNVDRIWAQWQQNNPAALYQPQGQSANTTDPLYRQRVGDPMYSILSSDPPVSAMLDVSQYYNYG